MTVSNADSPFNAQQISVNRQELDGVSITAHTKEFNFRSIESY